MISVEYVFMLFAALAFGFMLASIYVKQTGLVMVCFSMVVVLSLMAVGAAHA